MQKIILASASPRRKQLLEQIGLNFSCLPAEVDEEAHGSFISSGHGKQVSLAEGPGGSSAAKQGYCYCRRYRSGSR